MNAISAAIARRIILCKYVSLGNLILDRYAIRELLQERFTVPKLMEEVTRLTEDEEYRARMLADYAEIRTLLGDSGASEAVAKAMMKDLKA